MPRLRGDELLPRQTGSRRPGPGTVAVGERLVESYPKHYGCLQLLAVGSLIQGDFAGALQGFTKVLETFPDDRYARLGQAKVLLAQSRQAEAIGLVDEVLAETSEKIVKGDFEAYDYWLVAACHTLLGDTATAYEWFDKAAEAGRRFSLWDASDPLFASLRGDSRFDNYLVATRVARSSN
ncbi:MAG: tetratricopeptide repeat protein [Pseudomonadota bacterium]